MWILMWLNNHEVEVGAKLSIEFKHMGWLIIVRLAMFVFVYFVFCYLYFWPNVIIVSVSRISRLARPSDNTTGNAQ